uniref:NADH-ubiquinone oxidoreductase chain 4L n=1 Tax=Phalangium opilio TaxID=118624 RepID=B2CKZ2_PHAOP|nr:NADH dehydrogenase subunit 4L [Phalangium opilio]ACA66087.1 NADH dehydrogenase subunit 4L [Phalangium opilio]
MVMLNFYVFCLFFGGLMCVVLSRYHLLVVILSLEFLMLSVFLLLVFSLSGGVNNCIMMMLYLFVVVCEGSLGLGILVSLVKGYGGELCSSLNLLQC